MDKYQTAKIYKVVSTGDDGMFYIGSTIRSLNDRFSKHKSDYKRWQQELHRNVSVFRLFEQFGVENCRIELIEEYPCVCKEELRRREGEVVKELTNCVNVRVEGRDGKQYRIDNQEKITQYNRQIAPKVKEYNKQYREANWHILNQKFECECGGRYTRKGRSTHFNTQKHKRFMTQNSTI
jgi:hypothetical protein